MAKEVSLIIGNSNHKLFSNVCDKVKRVLESQGLKVTIITPRKSTETSADKSTSILEKFSNGECHVDIGPSLRGQVVYVMQTEDTTAEYTANDYFMELCLLISACKLSNAAQINAVIPNYFYARQDKKDRPHVPISASLVADMLVGAGAHRIMVCDLHSSQIQGFFTIPCDNLYAIRYLLEYVNHSIVASGVSRDKFCLVSPDLGGEKRINAWSKAMHLPFVLASKERDHTKASVVERIAVYGTLPATDCIGIIVDDMIDTAGTMVNLTNGLITKGGFREFWVIVTHGILSGPAVTRLATCPQITRIICTNTIDRTEMQTVLPKLEIVDVSELFARAIINSILDKSISELFSTTTSPTPLLRPVPAPTIDADAINLS